MFFFSLMWWDTSHDVKVGVCSRVRERVNWEMECEGRGW